MVSGSEQASRMIQRERYLIDTYVIEEQRCETNEGMNLLKIEVTVYRDSVTIDLGTLTDDRIEIGNDCIGSGDWISSL